MDDQEKEIESLREQLKESEHAREFFMNSSSHRRDERDEWKRRARMMWDFMGRFFVSGSYKMQVSCAKAFKDNHPGVVGWFEEK